MNTSIKFLGIILLLGVLWSCSSEPSLQKYYVAHQEDDRFMTMDISTNMIFQQLPGISEEARATIQTIKKINVLALPIDDDNVKQYKKEREKVKSILDKEDYHLLMKFNFSKGHLELRYLGKPDAIKEVVVLTYSDDKGFAVARLLGDDMRPDAFIEMIQASKKGDLEFNEEVLEGLFK